MAGNVKRPARKSTVKIARDFLARVPSAYLFPIKAGRKEPPCLSNNLELAFNDEPAIKVWVEREKGCNWGVALKKSRLIVMDVDCKAGKVGRETLDMLELEHGWLPSTLTIGTPSGGLHYYFAETSTARHVMRVGAFGKDVDSTNYVLIAGCTLDSGGAYTVINDAPIAPAPAWFAELFGEKEVTTVEQVPEIELDQGGNRAQAIEYLKTEATLAVLGKNGDAVTLQVAGRLKDMGVSEGLAIELMARFWNDRCDPPWNIGDGPDADRLDTKVTNAYRYLKQNAPGSATAEADFSSDPPDDAAVEQARQAAEDRNAGFTAPVESIPEEDDLDNDDRDTVPETSSAICKEWIWATEQKRFINRADTAKMFDVAQFDSMFNYLTERASISKVLFKTKKRLKRFDRIVYTPGGKEFIGRDYNIWRESAIKPVKGNTTLWNQHIDYLFPDKADRDRVLNWMAWVLQNPTRKPNFALLIVGKNTGTGKSFLARVMEQLVGDSNTQRPKNSSIGGDFNGWLLRCRLAIIEEMMQVGRRESLNALRDVITEPALDVNIKGVPSFKHKIHVALMGVSNHPDALPLDEHDRRWDVVETKAERRDPDYYARLFKEVMYSPAALAAIHYELLARPLNGYEAVGTAPKSAAKAKMIELSVRPLEAWLQEERENDPLNRRFVNIREDIVPLIPEHIIRETRGVEVAVAKWLTDNLGGVNLGNVRVGGRVMKLWAINSTGGFAARGKLKNLDVGATYKSDREAGRKMADDENREAPDDFAGLGM